MTVNTQLGPTGSINHNQHNQNHNQHNHNHNHNQRQQSHDGVDDPLRSVTSGAVGGSSSSSSSATATTAVTATTMLVKGGAGAGMTQSQGGDNETFIKKTKAADDMEKLRKLKELFDLGILTEVEYTDRKSQLVDEITGTRSGKNRSKYRGT